MRSVLIALVIGACVTPCYASLGAGPTDFGPSSARQARAMAGTRGASTSYTVNQTTLASGTTVREYVAPNGVVFAVSWSGPFLPDLRALLGQHFDTMTEESGRHPKAGHSQLLVKRADLTIESTGHMRAYSGRAWIASRMPAGVTPEEIE